MKQAKNIGMEVQPPTKECADKKCPFHGALAVRGREFTGVVIGRDVHHTATVEWPRLTFIQKYERYAKRRSKVRVHNPVCIDAQKGDQVKIMECRPLSKTKSFVIVQNLGKQFGFEQREAALEASKHQDKKAEEKEVGEDQ